MSKARQLADLLDNSGDVRSENLDNEISLDDNVKAKFGASDDLQIYHDGSNSYITDAGTGGLYLKGSNEIALRSASNENIFLGLTDGSAYVYHNGSVKLQTTSTGVDISGNVSLADSGKATFGASDDLQIYHDGSNSYIQDSGSGNLRMLVGNLQIRNYGSNENIITSTADAEVALYYNASQKLSTTSTGVDVTGTVTADGLTVDGEISGNVDLAAIAESKSDTAVDVFVYDTSKDSDGGAWRKRTQHTSWYNETLNTSTRGSRKEFPAVAVIVAHNGVGNEGGVDIYDATDAACPLWMRFRGDYSYSGGKMLVLAGRTGNGEITSVTMKDAKLYVGSSDQSSTASGLHEIDFITERCKLRTSDNSSYNVLTNHFNIAARNTDVGITSSSNTHTGLINPKVNDVAITVLPNAPIDSATGLPVPTIAVGTDNGISVIRDDGTVVDYTHNVGSYDITASLTFVGDRLAYSWDFDSTPRRVYISPLYSSDTETVDSASFQKSSTNTIGIGRKTGSTSYNANHVGAKAVHVQGTKDDVLAIGDADDGLTLAKVQDKKLTGRNTDTAYITSTYNTGWMNGDIKLATLSDTDDTDVVGSELVSNGTFDSDVSGWTEVSGSASTIAYSSGAMTCVRNNEDICDGTISGTIEAGKTYTFTFEITSTSSNSGWIYFSFGGGAYYTTSGVAMPAGVYSYTFVSPANMSSIRLKAGGVSGLQFTIDNVSLRLAEPDRSVNGNGLQVHGTIQKNPVATGADLVAYSGFSSSNYLEQPYNSDLDFGTGDFCIMGWVKGATTMSTATILSRVNGGTQGIHLYKNTTSATPYAQIKLGSDVYPFTTPIYGNWTHVVAVRQSGSVLLYTNGKLDASYTDTTDVSPVAMTTEIGWSQDQNMVSSLAGIALVRISATAPTAEQIAKIYRDEKPLFQENAKATLHGTSDAVTALAYDDDTELLHVGTSAGRSMFQGLRRVDNTTDAVGSCISAANGLVAED